jgi:penicillin-binding protein 1A
MRPLTFLALMLIIASAAGAGLGFFFGRDVADVRALEEYSPPVMSRILAADGTPLAAFARQRRILIEREEIPPRFAEALIATEDSRFYSHTGIDHVGVLRAAWVDLRSRRLSQGASTLTMQLARLLYLNRERTLGRKIREALLAMEIERNFSKEEILTLYCNQVYMGHGRYGLEAASRFYFDKSAGRLDLAEAALLAGIVQRPEGLSPLRHPEKARSRRDHVLDRMAQEGYITREEARAAKAAPVTVAERREPRGEAPWFVEEVRRWLKKRYGDEEIYARGLEVRTTLDPRLQEIANRAVAGGLRNLSKKDAPPIEAALVAIDPATGEIKAMVGGRDFERSKWNRATQARRQAGSAFKPFVFAAALAGGWSLADRLVDEPTTFTLERAREPYSPENYDLVYHGEITLRTALEKSANVAAVKLLLQVGFRPTIDLARALGIESPLLPYPSMALGAFEVTPVELTGAYASFANGGIHVEPHFVREVVEADGALADIAEPKVVDALDPALAHLMNHSLEGVVTDGTGRAAAALGRHLAGKTGTTDDNADAWFIGYSPDLAVGVWVGYDDHRSIGDRGTGALAALPIWIGFMEEAIAGMPSSEFARPEGVVYVAIDRESGLRSDPAGRCPFTILEAFIPGTEPTTYCSRHLPGHQPSEEPLAGGELVEAALLDDPPALDDVDAVGVAHRAQPVGDDHPGDPQPPKALGDDRLGLVVQGAGRLVEQQNLRPVDQGAR